MVTCHTSRGRGLPGKPQSPLHEVWHECVGFSWSNFPSFTSFWSNQLSFTVVRILFAKPRETKMDNETGLAILSAVLNGMSCPNRILTTKENKSTEIDVRDLHKILLTGCRYPPKMQNNTIQIQTRLQTENNITDFTINGKEIDNRPTTAVIPNVNQLNK